MEWIQNNWFNVLQSIGIIASVLFTAYVVRVSNKSKKVENLLLLNQYHREIWLYYLDNPHLSSIFKKDIPEDYNPTDIENRFVSIIILHLNTAFLATKAGVIERIEKLDFDVKNFFSLPVPRKIWELNRIYQNQAFLDYVERIINK